MESEFIKAKGHIKLVLTDERGEVKQKGEIDNVVCTVGKNFLATWLAASSQSTGFMPYVALGSGTTAASASDTALQTEFTGGSNARVAGTLTASTNVYQNVATFAAGNCTGAVTEAGLFSASSSGTIFAHQVFSAYNKAAGDTLTVTWQVTLG